MTSNSRQVFLTCSGPDLFVIIGFTSAPNPNGFTLTA